MPPPYIAVLVLIIAALGGWIVKSRVSRTVYQAGLIIHDMNKYQDDHSDLELDTKVGLEYLDNVTRALGVIKTIHIAMGLAQESIEEIMGERLINDNFYRLEFLHKIEIDEGQVFKQVFIESIPEIEDELPHGLTTEIWDLTEKAIDDLHAYSKKLLSYRKYMKMGLENAKGNGKFDNVDFEVTKRLAMIAGAEHCAYREWISIYETMRMYVEWVKQGLNLDKNLVREKIETLKSILELAYSAKKFTKCYVSNIGITLLSTNHSSWFEQARGEEMVKIQFETVNGKERSMQVQEIDNVFVAIGFTIKFELKPNKYRVEYSDRFALPSSKGTNMAIKMVS